MKNLIFIILCALMFSCASQKEVTKINGSAELLGFDFRPYSEKGFLITPYTYNGEYDAIGLLRYIVRPDAERVSLDDEPPRANSYNSNIEEYKWNIKDLKPEDAIEGIYQESVKMGADALVDFQIIQLPTNYDTDPPLTTIGYEISGFAIKRK